MAHANSFWKKIRLFFLFIQIDDIGPVLNTMAMLLENLSSRSSISRSTISSIYSTARIIAAVPNSSYQNKAMQMETHFDYFCYLLTNQSRIILG